MTQRGGKQKSSVENEFVVFRLLLASDWRKRVDYIHSSTKSWILEQFWCDIFTRKSLLKQIVDDVFCRFWRDFSILWGIFPPKNRKFISKRIFLRNEEIFFIRVWFYNQVYTYRVLENHFGHSLGSLTIHNQFFRFGLLIPYKIMTVIYNTYWSRGTCSPQTVTPRQDRARDGYRGW